ncbi:MAG: hypothetical protein ACU0CO_17085 [Shimia sp.]
MIARPSPTRVLPDGTVVVIGTDACWRGLDGYVAECLRVGAPLRCCQRHHARCGRVYRSLDVARDVRPYLDEAALDTLRAFLAAASATGARVPYGQPFAQEFTRAELGLLRMEVGNQLARVRSGRAAAPRPKGPRLDPSRLPDAALDRLIQTHRDLGLVERLRAEKARRMTRDRS